MRRLADMDIRMPFCKGGSALGELALSEMRGIREPDGTAYSEALIRVDGETRCLGHRPTLHQAGLLCTAAEKELALLAQGCQRTCLRAAGWLICPADTSGMSHSM
jgi:hypothetical protein